MGFSFAGLRKELESTGFRALYQTLRAECCHLAPFADHWALIAFFHDREADYGEKDIILHDLIGCYRQGGQYEALAAFFLVLFTPAIASLNAKGRRFYSEIGDEDLIQEICVAFLQTIRMAEIGPHKVASQIIGRVKNNVRSVLRRRFRERRNARPGRREGVGQGIAARHRFYPDDDGVPYDWGGKTEEAVADRPGEETAADHRIGSREEDNLPFVPDVSALFDDLEQRKVINRADREIIETTVIDRFSLKDIAATPAEYQRLKKRRQRALAAIRSALINDHGKY